MAPPPWAIMHHVGTAEMHDPDAERLPSAGSLHVKKVVLSFLMMKLLKYRMKDRVKVPALLTKEICSDWDIRLHLSYQRRALKSKMFTLE